MTDSLVRVLRRILWLAAVAGIQHSGACVNLSYSSSAAMSGQNGSQHQQFPDSKKCREIGTFVGEAS
jgi:hypothetical protein